MTPESTQEHADLLKALAQIREVIAAVDLRVSEYERVQRLQEVWNRTENRSSAKLKNGHVFRKQDMMRPGQVLKHQGPLLWKTATGRLKGGTAQPALQPPSHISRVPTRRTFPRYEGLWVRFGERIHPGSTPQDS